MIMTMIMVLIFMKAMVAFVMLSMIIKKLLQPKIEEASS